MKYSNRAIVEYIILALVVLGLVWVYLDWREGSKDRKHKGIIIAPADNNSSEK